VHVKEFTVNSPGLPAELHGGLTPCLRPLPALSLPPTSTDHLPEHTARATRTLAGSPFTVTPVRTGNPDTALQAMAVVHAAAARDRIVLWCTTSDEAADEAVENEVADTVTDIATARQRLTEHAWTMPAGTLLVVDHAVAAPPWLIWPPRLNNPRPACCCSTPARTAGRPAERSIADLVRTACRRSTRLSGLPPTPSVCPWGCSWSGRDTSHQNPRPPTHVRRGTTQINLTN